MEEFIILYEQSNLTDRINIKEKFNFDVVYTNYIDKLNLLKDKYGNEGSIFINHAKLISQGNIFNFNELYDSYFKYICSYNNIINLCDVMIHASTICENNKARVKIIVFKNSLILNHNRVSKLANTINCKL